MAIEFTFDPPLPEAVFVQLVEDNKGIPSRPLSLADFLPVFPFVPAQIDAGSATLQDLLGKGRLAYLTGTCQEDHLARQVLRDGAVEISLERHAELFLLQGKKSHAYFCFKAKKFSRPQPLLPGDGNLSCALQKIPAAQLHGLETRRGTRMKSSPEIFSLEISWRAPLARSSFMSLICALPERIMSLMLNQLMSRSGTGASLESTSASQASKSALLASIWEASSLHCSDHFAMADLRMPSLVSLAMGLHLPAARR